MTELIGETVALGIEQETSNTTKRFGGEKLDLGVGLLGVDESRRVHLNLLKVDSVSSNVDDHLLSISRAVVAVGGGEVNELGAVLLEKTLLVKIGGVSSSGENDRTVGLVRAAVVGVFDAYDRVALLNELGRGGLLEDLNALGLLLGNFLESLHLGVLSMSRAGSQRRTQKRENGDVGVAPRKQKTHGDGHSGELSTSTVSALERVSTETRNLGKVEAVEQTGQLSRRFNRPKASAPKLVGEPVDSISRATSEHLDEVVAGEVASLYQRSERSALGKRQTHSGWSVAILASLYSRAEPRSIAKGGIRTRTDFLVSSKNALTLSLIPRLAC